MCGERMQLYFPENKLKKLDHLMAKIGLKTHKDLINSALTLLRWSVTEVSSGIIIAFIDVKNGQSNQYTFLTK